MSSKSKTTYKDWQEQQRLDPEFVAESLELEAGYQIARLRISRGLTQIQLAEMVGTRQTSITRLKNGSSLPSISFLGRIAKALNATAEIKIKPKPLSP